jgi:glycosyltransferase involved in cell wall biosynthesis
MNVSLVIHAPNVHVGGGLVLLAAILDALDGSVPVNLVLHKRLPVPKRFPENVSVYRINPTLLSRFCGEWRLRGMVSSGDIVLCFGNLPPLFRLRGKVLLFLQNRYLVEPRSLRGFPCVERLRITLERLWFRWGKRNVTRFIVQTPSMQRVVYQILGVPSTILPFLKHPKSYTRVIDYPHDRTRARHGFLYVASGEPHKNHRNLLEAWTLLAREEIKPGLCLTLDKNRFSHLCDWIGDKIKDFSLNVINMGSISAQDLERVYKESLALIYPSDFESLGLPLIEARCAGLPILAAERDYVRDLIDPDETFDPDSPVSIARAVKRFLGIPEKPLLVTGAREWLSKISEIA